MTNMHSAFRNLALLLLLLSLAGCGGTRAFKAGADLHQQGRYEEAVAKFAEAVERSPESREYRLGLLKAKVRAAQERLAEGRRLAERGQYEGALYELRQARALDTSLAVAAQEIERVEALAEAEKLLAEAEGFYRARRYGNAKVTLTRLLEISPGHPRALELQERVQKSAGTLMDGFELDVDSDTTITLTFKSAKTKEVFGILSKLSGINFIFDEEMKEQTVSLSFEKATFSQALELLLRMNDLGKKVLNSKTIIIYSNSKEKAKQYEDHIIQTFYLSHIDAKKAVNMLRTMLQLRKIYVHEELNALVIRDTPQVIKLAQQVIEAADRGDAEVVLDLELVEVTHNNELKIGPTLSTNSVSFGLSKDGQNIVSDTLTAGSTTVSSGTDSTTTGLANNLVSGLSNLQTFYTLPTATFDVLRKLTDSEILANPSIRVKNKEKAKVHIGSREPVITVTINGDQTSENIQYVDVGVKLDVEPLIQLDNTVVTKLNLEVSNATRLAALKSGTTPLVISTTNATTALVLKDGEQTVIGGLLRDDNSKSKTTIPILGDIPLIGHFFTGHNNNKTKREILLSITPHIVKKLDMPEAAVASIWSGGEDELRAGANFGSFAYFKPELEEPLPVMAPGAAAVAAPPAGLPEGFVEAEVTEDYAEVVDGAVAATAETPVGGTGPLPGSTAVSSVETITPVAPAPESIPVAPVISPPAPAAADIPELPRLGDRARVSFTGPAEVGVGQEVVLEAMVQEITGLYSAPLFVRFDSQKLSFVRAEEGDFLKANGQSTLFTSSVNQEKGELIVGYKQGLGGPGATGSGKLFRLVFKGRAAGSAQVGFDRINFRDPAGNRLVVLPMSTTLEVR
ncbi:secretin N-terminal domain-containing protein [Desulfuromonas acetexigens]|uniref:Type II secretion system protein n=1 Tax=Trichloromonas acetexigens TaxID=38815 RepID=A0A550J8A1_9BACT|nr:secretin N-terminal domain-containing protein [Desulfuromonas acetexigens]TRO79474.1 type II secretion system protein [Desulfuromonas acetexigens]